MAVSFVLRPSHWVERAESHPPRRRGACPRWDWPWASYGAGFALLILTIRPGRFSFPGTQAGPDRSPMTDGSVTHWIGQVKEGGESVAEQELWDHYFSRLAALARQKLHDLPPHLRDDEDSGPRARSTPSLHGPSRTASRGFTIGRTSGDCWPRLPSERRLIGVARRTRRNVRQRSSHV